MYNSSMLQRRTPMKRTGFKRKTTKAVKLSTKPKVRRVSRGSVVKKLDAVYSQYIRLKDAVYMNGEWQATCVTCGLMLPWKQMQNGHYESRGNYATRWSDDNCHVQCVGCNVFKKGNYTEYARFMVRKYGSDKLDELSVRAGQLSKIPTATLLEKIVYYREQIDKMERT